MPREHDGNRLLLDRGRFGVAGVSNGLEKLRDEAEVGEAHGRVFRKLPEAAWAGKARIIHRAGNAAGKPRETLLDMRLSDSVGRYPNTPRLQAYVICGSVFVMFRYGRGISASVLCCPVTGVD
ncbi:hypothetical protein FACS189497_04440 [Betaproteobacteria bacterium]|nr:hypothetical protein FACS189497_04440 [Betaproteobacteria bacterium]